jgi:outer membrane protein assembly factor BamB
LVLALVFGTCWAGAADPPGGNWPQWRGPDRTNVSTETGLLKEWPEGGPPLLWKAEGLGEGVPSISVAGGKVFVLGYRDDKEFLTALNETDGKLAWSVPVGPAVKEMSIMRWLSQRTPTVDGDRVYAFTARGELICLATDDGKERWRKDYRKDFDAKPYSWGFCDFPLVDGDNLICTPGGATATMVALNKLTGDVIWKCPVPNGDYAAYGAVVVAEVGGVRQYVNYLSRGVIGVSSEGKFLWRYDGVTSGTANAYAPVVRGNQVFVASGYGTGFGLVKLVPEGPGVKAEEVYNTRKSLQPWLSSAVAVGDLVYLCLQNGSPIAVEFKTGKVVWDSGRGLALGGQAWLLYADGRAYLRGGNGKVVLAEFTAEGPVKKGEFTPPRSAGTEPTWTQPVIAGGRLYLRDHNMLLCYDLHEKKTRRRGPDVIFVPTPQDVVEKMLDLAAVKKDDVVADLGCGDGRIPVTAAKKYGCKAVGWDIDKECVRLSLEGVKAAGVEKLVRIERADIFDLDLSGLSVVTLYLGPTMNAKLIPQLEMMKPGSRIVSHAFDMPGVKPDKVVSVTSTEDDITRKLYLWTVPLKKEPRKE